ncbi:MAG: acyl-CoA dehydrogenase family protein [Acidobacteria bacterium]|nr:acyl-CoA dehydrogenase family protein [Acidobacteriota bacterium]
MDFDLSKPQKLLKQSARELLARECPPSRVRRALETPSDPELWQTIADQGWTGLSIAEEHGGLGTGLVELAVVMEEAGRVCMPGPFLPTMWAAAVLAQVGANEQLEKIAAGELKATVAIADGEEARFVMEAHDADLIVMVSGRPARRPTGVSPGGDPHDPRDSYDPGDPGDSRDWYDQGDSGDSRDPYDPGDPRDPHDSRDAAARDVPRPAGETPAHLITSGATVIRTPSMDETRKLSTVRYDGDLALRADISAATDLATVALCAEMVGGMQWVLDTTVEYAKTRQQFGKPIGAFQAVQHLCADMLLLTESARSATYYAAYERSPLAVSVAKAYCSDAYREVCNKGIQVHGGIGFTWEHDLQLYYKRAKASETLFGDATFHRERIATLVVDPAHVREFAEVAQ